MSIVQPEDVIIDLLHLLLVKLWAGDGKPCSEVVVNAKESLEIYIPDRGSGQTPG